MDLDYIGATYRANLAAVSASADAATDRRKSEADRADAYADALRDEACERASNLTTDPAALGEWIVDRMETNATFAERVLDLLADRLEVEVEAEWKAAREGL